MNQLKYLILISLAMGVFACNDALIVHDVNYGQPVESVLQPDTNGVIIDKRYGLSFDISPLQFAETGDSVNVSIDRVHLIRGVKGYYYITANNFKHVYIMKPTKGSLTLKEKVLVSDAGLRSPAFNLRSPFIQLVETENDIVYALDENGIQNQDKKS